MKTLLRGLMIAFMAITVPSVTTGCASIQESAAGLYHSTKEGAVNLYHSAASAVRGNESSASSSDDRCKKLSGSLYRRGNNPAQAYEQMRKAGCS